MNRFVPFLAIDPQPDPNPGSRDAEEASMEVRECCQVDRSSASQTPETQGQSVARHTTGRRARVAGDKQSIAVHMKHYITQCVCSVTVCVVMMGWGSERPSQGPAPS